jgi:hypothetical protein
VQMHLIQFAASMTAIQMKVGNIESGPEESGWVEETSGGGQRRGGISARSQLG